jgi:ATP-dependent DNA ligase
MPRSGSTGITGVDGEDCPGGDTDAQPIEPKAKRTHIGFRQACIMGLEGIVAKRRDRPYRSGRSPDWIKVKNPDAPAATRVIEKMERVEAYRRHAAECRLLAENARTGEDRTILLRMAQSWDMLAEELEFTKQVDQLRDSDR